MHYFAIIVVVLFLIWLGLKLYRSPKFDKWCNDIESGKLKEDVTVKDKMKDIVQAENHLTKQVGVNNKEAEKLQKESETIDKFLSKRSGAVDESSDKAKKANTESQDVSTDKKEEGC